MTEILRGKNSEVLGKLVEIGSIVKLFNVAGKMLGTYDKDQNITYDASGAVVAKSNLLVSLLKN